MRSTLFRGWRVVFLGAAAWILIGVRTPAADAPAEKADQPTLAPPKTNALRSPAGVVGTAEARPAGGPAASGNVPVRLSTGSPDESITTVVRPVPPATPDPTPGSSASPAASTPGEKPAGGQSDAPLRPIPEGVPTGPVEIQTASFNKITPGISTADDVQKLWGPPKQVKSQGGMVVHLYKVEPFEHVEVFLAQGKAASIVIRLSRAFPADGVAQQLALANLRPVLVSNALGEILGQSYPERGVLFSFEPAPAAGKVSMKVAQIILEPVTAEPFVLRRNEFGEPARGKPPRPGRGPEALGAKRAGALAAGEALGAFGRPGQGRCIRRRGRALGPAGRPVPRHPGASPGAARPLRRGDPRRGAGHRGRQPAAARPGPRPMSVWGISWAPGSSRTSSGPSTTIPWPSRPPPS